MPTLLYILTLAFFFAGLCVTIGLVRLIVHRDEIEPWHVVFVAALWTGFLGCLLW